MIARQDRYRLGSHRPGQISAELTSGCLQQRGDITMCLVPWRQALSSRSTTWPAAVALHSLM